MIRLLLPAALAAALVAASSHEVSSGRQTWPPAVEPLAAPAGASSAQPQLTTSTRGVLLSWVERTGDRATLKFAERTNDGWSPPRDVASGTDWFVNWADVPSVVRLDEGTLAAHWLQKSGPGTYAYDVRLAYSQDEGATWPESFTPHHDGTQTEHGFASLFPMPRGGLGLVWLDGRHMKGEHGGGGAMTIRFGAYDREWKQTTEAEIDARVCECCPTAAAVTEDGPIAVYRNRTEDETRDIYVSRLGKDGWTTGVPVHEDGWKIPGCPVNGPAISARGRDVVVAWFTVRENQGRAFAAFSTDAGRTFAPPVRLDDEASIGRVDVELLPDGSAAATYIEFAQNRAQLKLRRVERSGTRSAAVTVAGIDSGRTSGYPRLAATAEELILAWTEREGAATRVKTASVRRAAGTAGQLPRPR